jgi:hypothetical protein
MHRTPDLGPIDDALAESRPVFRGPPVDFQEHRRNPRVPDFFREPSESGYGWTRRVFLHVK